MSMNRSRTALLAGLVGSLVSAQSFAQSAPPEAAAPAPSPPPPTTASPTPTPAPTAPPPAIPPGYMLVPIPAGPPPADTRYDVQYPQHRGALPPGMELPYEDGDPIPAGYRLVKQRRRGLIIAGAITTGVPWSFGVIAAVSNDFRDNTGLLLIPVVGPWALLATNTARDQSCSATETVDVCTASKAGVRGVLVFDGLVQLAGGTMFAVGMFFPRSRLVRKDVVVGFVPTTFGRGAYGLGAVGSF